MSADLGALTPARITELRAIATRNLVECCDDCRALLREQLIDEESKRDTADHDGD